MLYRLSVSPHAENYLLKGALLFSLWYDLPKRPTRDADLLGFGAADTATAIGVIKGLCGIDVADGIELDAASVRGAEIRKEAGYGGVRIDLVGRLDGARIPLQIDIGFGDAVSPGPEPVTYPVLLQDLPAPLLRAYPKYTVIAEKFHAICLLGMANTRMKDYFDLSILLSEDDIEPAQLQTAVEATFARRKYRLPEGVPLGLTDAFAVDAIKQRQWLAFLQKNRLHAQNLTDTIRAIRESLIKMGAL